MTIVNKDFVEVANFFDKQKLALEATKSYNYLFYGGTKGSGKSRFLRWTPIYWLMYYAKVYGIRGVRAGLFCEDYPALYDRHISLIKQEFPGWLGHYNESRKEFTLSKRFGSGVLAFRNLDDPSDYESVEFAVVAIDELQLQPFRMFNQLRQRLRWPKIPDKDLKFIAAGLPGGEPYVINYWIDRNFPPDEKESNQFFFIKALPTDNPYLDKDYFDKKLASLTKTEKKAFLEGDFHAFDEQYDVSGYQRLLSQKQLNDALIAEEVHSGFTVLGVDPGAGGDESAIVIRSKVCQEVLFNQKLEDTMAIISIIVNIVNRKEVRTIVIDKGGIGMGIYDRLVEVFSGSPVSVVGISFNESSSDNKLFANKKAELYWKDADWILKGGKLVANDGWNEFLNIKYKKLSDAKVTIQSKEELMKAGFKSPNVVDASILTMAVDLYSMAYYNTLRGGKFVDQNDEFWK